MKIFKCKSFSNNLLGFQDSLRKRLFLHASLTPPIVRGNENRPDPPSKISVSRRKVRWAPPLAVSAGVPPLSYLIYLTNPDEVFDRNNTLKIAKYTDQNSAELQKRKERRKKPFTLRITTLDRNHNESEPSVPAAVKL